MSDKRPNKKKVPSVWCRMFLFFLTFLKELIRYQVCSIPRNGVQPDDDYKRVLTVFWVMNFFINKMSVMPQFGVLRVFILFDLKAGVTIRNWIKAIFFPE